MIFWCKDNAFVVFVNKIVNSFNGHFSLGFSCFYYQTWCSREFLYAVVVIIGHIKIPIFVKVDSSRFIQLVGIGAYPVATGNRGPFVAAGNPFLDSVVVLVCTKDASRRIHNEALIVIVVFYNGNAFCCSRCPFLYPVVVIIQYINVTLCIYRNIGGVIELVCL